MAKFFKIFKKIKFLFLEKVGLLFYSGQQKLLVREILHLFLMEQKLVQKVGTI